VAHGSLAKSGCHYRSKELTANNHQAKQNEYRSYTRLNNAAMGIAKINGQYNPDNGSLTMLMR